MTSGGLRTPSNPAVASGPGAMSQRTDGGPASKQAARWVSGGDYGDGGLMGIQQGAPMAASPTAAPASQQGAPGLQDQGPQVVPLTAPSQRPDEPVTTGAAVGPGAGPEVLRLPPAQMQGGGSAKQVVQGLAAHPDASPVLKQLADILGR